jgi:RHS repeat-associated protein
MSTFAYSGLVLATVNVSQSGGPSNDSWQFTYLHDATGAPYACIYRAPGTSAAPVVFGIITSDRGDVVALLDAAGAPFAAYRYDAWGNPQGSGNVATGVWSQASSPITDTLAAQIAGRQPLRYAGYYYDSESGLYYLSAREYDPQTGQFVCGDPAKTDGEESEYQYCAGNPVGRIDPSGLAFDEEAYNDYVAMCIADGREYVSYGAWFNNMLGPVPDDQLLQEVMNGNLFAAGRLLVESDASDEEVTVDDAAGFIRGMQLVVVTLASMPLQDNSPSGYGYHSIVLSIPCDITYSGQCLNVYLEWTWTGQTLYPVTCTLGYISSGSRMFKIQTNVSIQYNGLYYANGVACYTGAVVNVTVMVFSTWWYTLTHLWQYLVGCIAMDITIYKNQYKQSEVRDDVEVVNPIKKPGEK